MCRVVVKCVKHNCNGLFQTRDTAPTTHWSSSRSHFRADCARQFTTVAKPRKNSEHLEENIIAVKKSIQNADQPNRTWRCCHVASSNGKSCKSPKATDWGKEQSDNCFVLGVVQQKINKKKKKMKPAAPEAPRCQWALTGFRSWDCLWSDFHV